MKATTFFVVAASFLGSGGLLGLRAQDTVLKFTGMQRLTNGEISVSFVGPPSAACRIETADDLASWAGLTTLRLPAAASTTVQTDSAAPWQDRRFYRAGIVEGTNIFLGDHFAAEGGEITIQPLNHATLVMNWKGRTVYVDPTGSAAYTSPPSADLVLVTHSHSDHFSTATLQTALMAQATIVCPNDVYSKLTTTQKGRAVVLSAGGETNLAEVSVRAVPAYGPNHPQGLGLGYLFGIGGRRVYVTGDTGNTPEMRALKDIDVAFVCMNQPYTMTVSDATNAVAAFKPKIVYPYHYRDSSNATTNAAFFKQRLDPALGIEVRLRKWY